MKPEHIFERRQAAVRVEMVLLVASLIGTTTAVCAFLNYGWIAGLSIFLLSLICYGLSRLFDFLGDLMVTLGRQEQSKAVKDKDAT